MRLVTGAVRATALAAVLRGACQGLMRRSTLRSCVAMRARRCDHMHTHGVRERRRHSPSSAGKQIFANHGCNPARRRLRRPAFQLQQGLFGRQPATESGQCATGTDDAVTGQHDRQRIAAVCGAPHGWQPAGPLPAPVARNSRFHRTECGPASARPATGMACRPGPVAGRSCAARHTDNPAAARVQPAPAARRDRAARVRARGHRGDSARTGCGARRWCRPPRSAHQSARGRCRSAACS